MTDNPEQPQPSMTAREWMETEGYFKQQEKFLQENGPRFRERSKFGSISNFDLETEYWFQEGFPFGLARRKAIDYHRKFLSRESSTTSGIAQFDGEESKVENFREADATPDSWILGEGNWTDANFTPEDRANFNDIVEMIFEMSHKFDLLNENKDYYGRVTGPATHVGLATKWIANEIRKSRADSLLNKRNKEFIEEALGSESFDREVDFCEWYKPEWGRRKGSRLHNNYQGRRDWLLTNVLKPAVASIYNYRGVNSFIANEFPETTPNYGGWSKRRKMKKSNDERLNQLKNAALSNLREIDQRGRLRQCDAD